MGMLNTPGQADALCTVIALGFIISSEGQLKDHSYIIYLDGTDDDAEYRRHRQLEAKLAKLTGMKKLFDPKPQTPGGKSRQPVILAQTNRSVLQGEIMEHEKAIFKILEDKVNLCAALMWAGSPPKEKRSCWTLRSSIGTKRIIGNFRRRDRKRSSRSGSKPPTKTP